MRISFSVMAHPSRDAMAEGIADELQRQGHPSPVTICYDTDGIGEVANGDIAWAQYRNTASWHIVLQDDAVLQPYSLEQMHKALAVVDEVSVVKTAAMVSFYVGTGRPRQKPVQEAFQRADRADLAWLESDTLLWGVAVAMTPPQVGRYLRWGGRVGGHGAYDERLGRFARSTKLPVRYTWPSLVDHRDGPTLLQHPWGAPKGPRIAYRLGRRDNWETRSELIR